jgi:hypothetical protein
MRRELLIAALLIAPRAADAGVLSEDALEGRSTEAGVIARAFSLAFAGETLEPPSAPDDMSPSSVGMLDLRLYAARRTPSWQLVVHDQLTSVARSHDLGASLGRGVPPPRWLPLAWSTDDPTLSLSNTVEWVYASYTRGPVTATVGRQPITFGRAKLWSPSDLVAAFSITEIDTEYKPGADALRVDVTAGERTTFTVVGAAGELESDHDLQLTRHGSAALARGQYTWDRVELGVLGGYVRGDGVVGVDAMVDAGAAELYGEATATLVTKHSLPSPIVDDGEVAPRAVLGANVHRGHLTGSAELWWNGFGATDDADYLPVAMSERVAIGEQVTVGRAYAMVLVDWEAHPLLHVGGVALTNLLDPSALGSIVLSYSAAENVQARLGAYVPLGARPDPAMPGTTPSELGQYPYFGFAELKLAI